MIKLFLIKYSIAILLSCLLGITMTLIIKYQLNDQMLMKQWIELLWIEFLAQSIYHEITKK